MSTFFIIMIAVIALSSFSSGGKKKRKTQRSKGQTSARKNPQGWNLQEQDDVLEDGPAPFNPSSSAISALMRSREISQDRALYKANAAQDALQDDGQPSGFYELSKARAVKVRREAAAKLEYDGLPEIEAGENVQRFETTAKSHVSAEAIPLVRDMNAARRRALSSERAVSAFGLKHLLGYGTLGGLALFVLSRV